MHSNEELAESELKNLTQFYAWFLNQAGEFSGTVTNSPNK